MGEAMRSYEIPPRQRDEVLVAGGGVNPELTESIASSIGVEAANLTLKRHANDELYGRFNETVRGKDVFVVQSHHSSNGYTSTEAFWEHVELVSAAAGASARSVCAVAPYLIHSRGDRKAKGREVVPGPLVIRCFEVAGMKTKFSMMSLDVHAQQTTEDLRTGVYEHLTAQPEIRRAVLKDLGSQVKNCVIVSPDAGAMKNNNRHADEITEETGLPIQVKFLDKVRGVQDTTELKRPPHIPGIKGKIVLSFDDMLDGGGTSASLAETCKRKGSGAEKVYIGATHAVFSGKALDTIMNSEIDKVFVTDTVPIDKAVVEQMGDRLVIVRIGPLIGRVIYEMVTDGSISKVFDDQNHR